MELRPDGLRSGQRRPRNHQGSAGGTAAGLRTRRGTGGAGRAPVPRDRAPDPPPRRRERPPGPAAWRTGGAGTPNSVSQAASCSEELTYTMRPSPTQPCAAAHIGQCSPEVNTVAPARSSGVMFAADQRASSNSGCRVRSPAATRLRSSPRTVPSAATSTEPNGSSPASSASAANSTQRRRCRSSSSFTAVPPLCELQLIPGRRPTARHRVPFLDQNPYFPRCCGSRSSTGPPAWFSASRVPRLRPAVVANAPLEHDMLGRTGLTQPSLVRGRRDAPYFRGEFPGPSAGAGTVVLRSPRSSGRPSPPQRIRRVGTGGRPPASARGSPFANAAWERAGRSRHMSSQVRPACGPCVAEGSCAGITLPPDRRVAGRNR